MCSAALHLLFGALVSRSLAHAANRFLGQRQQRKPLGGGGVGVRANDVAGPEPGNQKRAEMAAIPAGWGGGPASRIPHPGEKGLAPDRRRRRKSLASAALYQGETNKG